MADWFSSTGPPAPGNLLPLQVWAKYPRPLMKLVYVYLLVMTCGCYEYAISVENGVPKTKRKISAQKVLFCENEAVCYNRKQLSFVIIFSRACDGIQWQSYGSILANLHLISVSCGDHTAAEQLAMEWQIALCFVITVSLDFISGRQGGFSEKVKKKG